MVTKTTLLNKNPLSLDVSDSICLLDFSSGKLRKINIAQTVTIIATKARKIGPSDDSVKE